MNSNTDDITLIKQAIDGNQKAYKTLYEQHIDLLFRFLIQFTTDRVQVQEWCQRAFIKAFDKISTFKHQSSFKTWLFTIGLNEMRTDFRSNKIFEELPNSLEEITIEENIHESDLWWEAKEAIRSLSTDKKMIVLLHIAEGYSHKEIGKMLSIKEGTSRIILHRAKEELKANYRYEQ